MAHVPSELKDRLLAAAPTGIDILFKPMFGGIGVYADGRMFCSLSDVGLALKLGADEREELLRIKGAKPLQYEPGSPPSKTYVVVPGGMLKDASVLRKWLARSAAFTKSEPAKKPGKKRA